MSRYNTQSIAPGMSSGRSRGSSLGQGGFSATTQTTTVKTTTTNTIHHSGNGTHYPDEYSHYDGGSSCAHGHLCMIDEEDYDSDDSDYTVVGRVSNLRLSDRTDSRSRASSRPSGSHYSTSSRTTDSHHPTSRTSHRPSGSHYSTSRPTDSHRRSTQTSSRPSESHYSSSARPNDSRLRITQGSSRPSESHYQSSRPTDSYQPSSRTSHRPSESHYQSSRPAESHRRSTLSSSRPSESRTYGAGKEVTVFAEPSSREKGSTDKTKSSRRDSKAMKGIKSLVKHI